MKTRKFSRALAIILVLLQVAMAMTVAISATSEDNVKKAGQGFVNIYEDDAAVTIDGTVDASWADVDQTAAKFKTNEGSYSGGNYNDLPTETENVKFKAFYKVEENGDAYIYWLIDVVDNTKHAATCTCTSTCTQAFHDKHIDGFYIHILEDLDGKSGTENGYSVNTYAENRLFGMFNRKDATGELKTTDETPVTYFQYAIGEKTDGTGYVVEAKSKVWGTATDIIFNVGVMDGGTTCETAATAGDHPGNFYTYSGDDSRRAPNKVWHDRYSMGYLIPTDLTRYAKTFTVYKIDDDKVPDLLDNTKVSDTWTDLPWMDLLGEKTKVKAVYNMVDGKPVLYILLDVADATNTAPSSGNEWKGDGVHLQVSENRSTGIGFANAIMQHRRTARMDRFISNGIGYKDFFEYKVIQKDDNTGYSVEIMYKFGTAVESFAMNMYTLDGGEDGVSYTLESWTGCDNKITAAFPAEIAALVALSDTNVKDAEIKDPTVSEDDSSDDSDADSDDASSNESTEDTDEKVTDEKVTDEKVTDEKGTDEKTTDEKTTEPTDDEKKGGCGSTVSSTTLVVVLAILACAAVACMSMRKTSKREN